MYQISRWLSLYWFVLLPLFSIIAAGFIFRAHQRWQQWKSSPRSGTRWLFLGLGASQVYINLLILNSLYEVSLWPAVGALLAVLVMLLAKWGTSRWQRKSLIPALMLDPVHGPILYEVETHKGSRMRSMLKGITTTIPFIPGMVIVIFVLSQVSNRWWGLWLIILALLSPLLLTRGDSKNQWLATFFLTLIPLAFGLHAFNLRHSLPAGNWSTPITGASCSRTIHLDMDRKVAWCANDNSGRVYQFKPNTGIVGQGLIVDNSAQPFAGDSTQVWVMQDPVKGLVLVENGQQRPIKINFPRQGTVDTAGRLWVIDVTGLLWVRLPTGEWHRLNRTDGLINNTATVVKTSPDGSVWVGSIGGVSLLAAGSSEWQHIIRGNELPGDVQDFAFTNDGKVWYLWEAASAYRSRVRWGVSHWHEFHWNHFELGVDTGLDYPASNHTIAIDGFGRVWFVAPSYIQKYNFLGILEPSSGLISIYSLGPFDITPGEGNLFPGYNGVIDDGTGGIFIYNPKFSPLRHWRPGMEPEKYQPCTEPCLIAARPQWHTINTVFGWKHEANSPYPSRSRRVPNHGLVRQQLSS